jgi:hypothetical protein
MARRGKENSMANKIKEDAKAIDPDSFVSWWTYGSVLDPYGLGPPDCEDNVGRVWWVSNADDDSFAVTAWDFTKAYPEVSSEEIYAREEQWSKDTDLLHGIFR